MGSDQLYRTPQIPTADLSPSAVEAAARVSVKGKFLYWKGAKLWVKGITYGTFSPDDNGQQFPDRETTSQDFKTMAGAGFNTVRVYTVPPLWLLDLAEESGLLVLVGLPWEQHVCFLDDDNLTQRIIENIRSAVATLRQHPAILAFAIGNEIPGSIVRWHGKLQIEAFLKRLYTEIKAIDPQVLVTYVNYPTTEYLELPFLDFVSFNVYLEEEAAQKRYLQRLQNLAGDRPLLLAEIGLDSLRNGELKQAQTLKWQIGRSFAEGCCGICLFAWTDEWYRGGHEILDWEFGLVSRERKPKPALAAVQKAFESVPLAARTDWPSFSVVVCSYNGEPTIRDTFEALQHLNYPNFDVIVIDDGSTDRTAAIAAEYDYQLISTENRGLSAARNLGWKTSTAEIIAYIDDDAYPDPDWLNFLAIGYLDNDYAGIGGPNLAPPGDGWKAECIACAPGGPVHVLLSDTLAEHIPGCNMSFRRAALATVGGFDPRYRTAGDDVDICWRVQQEVGEIGFVAAAMVWHHRRNSFKTYWKQQRGYGRAEALLEAKWPEKYNAAGHLSWSGRIYGTGLTRALRGRQQRIYQGTWGSAPFQSIYQPADGFLSSLPLMPEWYLLISLGTLLTLGALLWLPLLWFALPTLIMLAVTLAQAIQSTNRALATTKSGSPGPHYWATVGLHLMQPLARLSGRIANGLHPWRKHGLSFPALPFQCRLSIWREQGEGGDHILQMIRQSLGKRGHAVITGNDFDNWDLQVRPGILTSVRLRLGLEEHGSNRQLLRLLLIPRISPLLTITTAALLVLATLAALDQSYFAAVLLAGTGILSLVIAGCSCAHGIAEFRKVIEQSDAVS